VAFPSAVRRRARPTHVDGPAGGIVAPERGKSQRAHSLTVLLGLGRVGLGAAFLAFPVGSVRLLGIDSASAARMAWLARLAAARDVALGAGVLGAAVTHRGRVSALVATSLCDAADAAVVAAAAREQRVDRLRGYAMAGGAAAAALAGLAVAGDLLRR
jgi:hypothetical protein